MPLVGARAGGDVALNDVYAGGVRRGFVGSGVALVVADDGFGYEGGVVRTGEVEGEDGEGVVDP